MSEITHTPGPWMVVEHNWSDTGITGANEYVCLLEIRDCSEECEVAMSNRMAANGRLIAASPELLELLQEVVAIGDTLISDIYGYEFKEKARAVLAKATGSQS